MLARKVLGSPESHAQGLLAGTQALHLQPHLSQFIRQWIGHSQPSSLAKGLLEGGSIVVDNLKTEGNINSESCVTTAYLQAGAVITTSSRKTFNTTSAREQPEGAEQEEPTSFEGHSLPSEWEPR